MIDLSVPNWIERAQRVASALRTPYGRASLRRGVAPTAAPQRMLRRVAPAVVIDVGANRGQFALDVLTACPRASVISFEPLDSEADVFEVLLGKLPRVHLIRTAVSDRTGDAPLHVSAAADSSSLHPVGALQCSTFPGTHEVGVVDVPVTRLDDVSWTIDLPASTLIKIDVQGHELAVLRGATELLRRARWVYVEVSLVEFYEHQALATEVIEFLSCNGFQITDIVNTTVREGRTVQADLLFERLREPQP